MVELRRIYTAYFKIRVALELLCGKKSISQASREHGVKDNILSRWRQESLERVPEIVEQPGQENEQARRIAELEPLVGYTTVQLDIAKKVFGMFGLSIEARRMMTTDALPMVKTADRITRHVPPTA